MYSLLFSKNWDTRIASGYAIEYIFKALPAQFTDLFEPNASEQNKICNGNILNSQLLKEMDLTTEINSRKALLASAGAEFDLDLTISAAERLRISRANMKKTLGLDEISGMEELERELVKDEDLTATQTTDSSPSLPAIPTIDLEKLSARERIAMKRKARLKPQAPPPKQEKKSKLEETGTSEIISTLLDNNTAGDYNSNYDGAIESDSLWFCERMKEKLLK